MSFNWHLIIMGIEWQSAILSIHSTKMHSELISGRAEFSRGKLRGIFISSLIDHLGLCNYFGTEQMKNYDIKWLTNVLHAYHFSYKILLLISAPICHPNFSQSVPCSRLSFPDRREIDKHSLQRRNIIITNYARGEMRNNSMNNSGVKRFVVSRAVIVDNFCRTNSRDFLSCL